MQMYTASLHFILIPGDTLGSCQVFLFCVCVCNSDRMTVCVTEYFLYASECLSYGARMLVCVCVGPSVLTQL